MNQMNDPIPIYTRDQMLFFQRQARRSIRVDAWIGIIAALIVGYGFAQLAIKFVDFGILPRRSIGPIAIIVQLVTFAGVMGIRLGSMFYRKG